MKYVAELRFSKETPNNRYLRKEMSNEFLKLYNEAVHKINPQYECWNALYDELYPERNTGENSEDYKHYNDYIADRHKTVFDEVNKKGILIELFSGEEATIWGRMKLRPEWTMCFVLKEN